MPNKKPPRSDSKHDWEAITANLRAQPEEWVLVAEGVSKTLYSAVRRQRVVAVRDPEWKYEACTRNTKRTEQGLRVDLWMMARTRQPEEMETWDSRL